MQEIYSYNDSIGTWEDTTRRDVFINGIRTSEKEVRKRYEKSSEICNGKIMHFIYNAMHGLVADLLEWTGQRIGIPTNSVNKLVENIRTCIAELGGVEGEGKIHVWAHSQGGEIMAAARRYLTQEEMAMIEVKTYGSANLFSKGHFANVTHYVSTRDWVPLMANPIQYTKACYNHRPEVVFLPAEDNFWFDHSFEGKTYQTQFAKDTHHIR